MKIGETIDVKLEWMDSFRSKIIDIKNKQLYINYPKELPVSFLRISHSCSLYYLDDNIPHHFETTLEGYSMSDIPYIVVSLPDEEDIQRIQRREYVRIPTDVDVAVYFKSKNLSPIVTVTQDISGGGMRAVLKKELPLKENEPADVYMVLRTGKGNEYIHMKAKVVHTHIEQGVYSFSIAFLFDNEKIRQKIISYCFQIQRERRKQGLG